MVTVIEKEFILCLIEDLTDSFFQIFQVHAINNIINDFRVSSHLLPLTRVFYAAMSPRPIPRGLPHLFLQSLQFRAVTKQSCHKNIILLYFS